MSEVSKQRVRLANAVLNSETMKEAALGGRGAGADIKQESFSDRQAAALEIEEVWRGFERGKPDTSHPPEKKKRTIGRFLLCFFVYSM